MGVGLSVDTGNLHRDIVDIGLFQRLNGVIVALVSLFVAEHDLTEEVDVLPDVLLVALSQMLGQPLVRHTVTWRVWHECTAILLLLCFISVGNFVLDWIWFRRPLSIEHFLGYTYATFLIGIPVTHAIVALDYQKRLHNRLATLLQKDESAQEGQTITFHDASVWGENLTLPMADFLYAEARKSFVDVYFLREGRVEHWQLRATLALVLADAKARSIFQCHRSFIVNLNRILSAHGNSNGYQLTVGDERHVVPVSRSYVAKLRSFVV